jgi:hypothetical protein
MSLRSLVEMNHSYASYFFLGTSEHAHILRGTDCADAFDIGASLNNFNELQVLEIVDIYFVLKDHYDSIIMVRFHKIITCLFAASLL